MYVCPILNLEYSGIFHQKWNIPQYDKIVCPKFKIGIFQKIQKKACPGGA